MGLEDSEERMSGRVNIGLDSRFCNFVFYNAYTIGAKMICLGKGGISRQVSLSLVLSNSSHHR